MHWSKLFIPTLRPTLRDDHPLLERAGYIRQLSGGIHSHLFLGQRSLLKITAIVREEMNAIGAQEFHLPAAKIRPEEAMVSIASGLLRSYKQLPQIWFTKRGSCSFDINAAALDISYEKHLAAYSRIFDRCGLEYIVIGGDFVVHGANYVETHDPAGDLTPEEFHTPNVKTIADLARFTGLPETSHMKSLVMVADGEPVLVLLRGDHQLNEGKLGATVRAARPEELQQWFGADAGSLGPIGVSSSTICARRLKAIRPRSGIFSSLATNIRRPRICT
jgi:prolyl-tRNA synthetase